MILRPYQDDALDASHEKMLQGVMRQLVVLPTGTGKTPLFSYIRQHHKITRRQMCLVHTDELANQAVDQLREWNPGISVGKEMAGSYASDSDELVVGSTPTFAMSPERLRRFDPSEFGLVVPDEAHHSTSDSWRGVFNHFDLLGENRHNILLHGVTATPNRGDGTPLADVYQEIVYQYSIRDAIEQGWLVKLRGIRVTTEVSLDNLKSLSESNASLEELAKAIDTPVRNNLIVDQWLDHAIGRQTIAFCANIKHAQNLALAFAKRGIPAQAVWGTDPDRKAKIEAHKRGDIAILTNCGLLTEGYDDWRVRCIIMARPTQSQLLFMQCIGRGTRLPKVLEWKAAGIDNLLQARAAGLLIPKDDCIVLDVADNTKRHRIISLGTLFGLPSKMDMRGRSITDVVKEVEEIANQHPGIDLDALTDIALIRAYAKQVDLFEAKYPEEVLKSSKCQWYKTPAGSYILRLPKGEHIEIYKDLLNHWYVMGTVKGNEFSQSFDSLDDTFPFAERMLKSFGGTMTSMVRRTSKSEKGWRGEKMSTGQFFVLRRLLAAKGEKVPDGLSKGQANELITKLQNMNMGIN